MSRSNRAIYVFLKTKEKDIKKYVKNASFTDKSQTGHRQIYCPAYMEGAGK